MEETFSRNITVSRAIWSAKRVLPVLCILAALIAVPAFAGDHSGAKAQTRHPLLAAEGSKPVWEKLAEKARKAPVSEEQALALADLLESQGRLEEEAELLEKQWGFHPRSTNIGERLVEVYIQLDQSERAIPVVKRLLSLRPQEPRYWKRLGTLFLWTEKQKEAMLAFEQAVRLDPGDAESLKQLAQLYEWNGKEREAFELEKRLLKLEPGNLELWKKYGLQARWLGKNHEAIVAFKNILMRDPHNTEAFFLLGETYLWEGDDQRAELCFRQVLKDQPQNAQAHFYMGQVLHWRPFGWWEARKHYQEALYLDPYHKDARKYLNLIRRDYGPQSTARYYYIHDSNDLEKSTATASHGQYLSPRFYLQGNFYSIRLFERKLSGNFLAAGQGSELRSLWHASTKTRFAARAGFVNYHYVGSFVRAALEWQQTVSDQPRGVGHLYSTLGVLLEPVLDGVLAVKSKTTARRMYQSFYWQPDTSFHLGTDFRYGWYSDRNEKLQFVAIGEYRFYRQNPELAAEGLFAYENTKTVFPDAEPYWTPDHYWTRSLGLLVRYRWLAKWRFMGGLALTQQPESDLATNWKLQVEFAPNDFTHFQILFQNYGSRYYSYQNVQAQLSYRW